MDFFKRFAKAPLKEEEEAMLAEDLESLNPYNTVQILRDLDEEVRMLELIDDKRLLTVGVMAMHVWEIKNAALISTLDEHTHPITCVIVHQKRVVSCSFDNTIKIWDPDMGAALQTIAELGTQVFTMKPLVGEFFCVCGTGVHVLSIITGKVRASLPDAIDDNPIQMIEVASPVAIFGACAGTGHLSVYTLVRNYGGMEGLVHVDAASEPIKQKVLRERHPDRITTMANCGTMIATGCRDGSVLLWSTKTLAYITTIKPVAPSLVGCSRTDKLSQKKHATSAAAALSVGKILPLKGGKYIAVAHGRHIRVVSLSNGAIVTEVPEAHNEPIQSMTLTHRGLILVTCANDIRLWSLAHVIEDNFPRSPLERYKDVIRVLESCKDSYIEKWDEKMEQHASQTIMTFCERQRKSDTLTCLGVMDLHEKDITDCLAIGEYVFVTSSVDQSVCMWQNGAYKSLNDNLAINHIENKKGAQGNHW